MSLRGGGGVGSTGSTPGGDPVTGAEGGRSAEACELVGRALLPLAALGTDLHHQATTYVIKGGDRSVLDRLVQADSQVPPDAPRPGSLLRPGGGFRGGVSQGVRDALERVGVAWPEDLPADSAEPVYRLRDPLYRVPPSPAPDLWQEGARAAPGEDSQGLVTSPVGAWRLGRGEDREGAAAAGALGARQWVRWAEVLQAADPTVPTRPGRAGEPAWLRLLVDDVLGTCPPPDPDAPAGVELLRRHRPAWTAGLLSHLLTADGVPGDQVPHVLLRACWSGPVRHHAEPATSSIPGAAPYLSRFWDLALPSGAEALQEDEQQALLRVLHQERPVPTGLAGPLAGMAVSPYKRIRSAAVSVLADVDPRCAVSAVAATVACARPREAEDALAFLLSSDTRGTSLAEVLDRAPGLTSLAERLRASRGVLAAEGDEGALPGLPPFSPLPDASAAPAAEELRRALARTVQEGEDGGPWARDQAERAQQVGEEEIDQLVAVAEGRHPGPSRVVGLFDLEWVARKAPSLDLIHLTRLAPSGPVNQLEAAIGLRVGAGSDLRIVEDALRRGSAPAVVQQVMEEVFMRWVWTQADPQDAWPWMLQQGDVLVDWLASSTTATPVLRALQHAPSLPAPLLPALARTAVGASPRNRELAQALLADHPGVRDLATATLGDPRAAVRRAGAAWLASLADPRSVAALRQAYATEKSWQVRAGILQALQASGDDVSDVFSPHVLTGEARRGSRRLPAALGWLDLGLLPRVRWDGGEPVDPAVVRWLVVLAHRLGSPDGRGMIQTCLGLLEPGSAARLGGAVIEAWAAFSRDAAKGASLPTKGLLAFAVAMEGETLGRVARACLRASATRRAESEAVLEALRASAAPEAVQVLAAASQRHRLPRVRDAARVLLEDLARERGWSTEELADRTIPTAGFSPDGLLHLDYGSRELLGRVGADLTVVLSDSQGRPLRSLPRARKDEDGERVAQARRTLTAARKESRAVLEAQTGRLYAAMCAGRSWPSPVWYELLASHPLVSRLVTRLVWVAQDAGGVKGRRTFRPAEDGVLLTADDEVVELDQGAAVSLAHGSLMSPLEVEAWLAHLEDYEVTPLFDQLGVPAAPSPVPGQVYLEDLKGRRVPAGGLQQVMRARGYQRGSFHLSWAGEYHKEVPAAGLRVVIAFEGRPGAGETVVLGGLSLVRAQRHRPVPVDQVPPVLLAECHADYMACADLA